MNIFILCVELVLIFVALFGNLLVIIAVATEYRLRRVKNNVFIVSLSVSSFFMALLIMPAAVYSELHTSWTLGKFGCRLRLSLEIMFCTAAAWSIALVCHDRYKHVSDPVHRQWFMTPCITLLHVAGIWLLAAALSLPNLFLNWNTIIYTHYVDDSLTGEHEGHQHYDNNYLPVTGMNDTMEDKYLLRKIKVCVLHTSIGFGSAMTCVAFLLPLVPMLVSFLRLYALTQRFQNLPELPATPNKRGSTGSSGRVGVSRAFLGVAPLGLFILYFLVCWLPFFITFFRSIFRPELVGTFTFKFTVWVGYSNSCVNPILLGVSTPSYHEAFKRILTLRTCQKGGEFYTDPRFSSVVAAKGGEEMSQEEEEDALEIAGDQSPPTICVMASDSLGTQRESQSSRKSKKVKIRSGYAEEVMLYIM
ncbi:5-hydroxytryptamine receptor 1-like [Aplysia californica]|uniref:5-hydroxytryptamine receptor 1-like n=1 Tax=Aplysia californica TaxID=6500 RepID=A0ABM0ZW58_APLCA|nr:5-hydroxytryptamine receptor 1-like [Aplysia californica]XP_012935779.1 5-hydroxytryptamine receptor 1-like [Aplysia californica]